MKKQDAWLEIEWLLNRIQKKAEKAALNPDQVPTAYVEQMQDDVMQIYKKLLKLEWIAENSLSQPEIHASKPEIIEPVQVHTPSKEPEPLPIVEKELKPELTEKPSSVAEPEISPANENADSFIEMVKNALSGTDQKKTNPFQTAIPEQKPEATALPKNENTPAASKTEIKPDANTIAQQKATFNPTAGEPEMPTILADRLRQQGIADLKKAIPIADKFLFMNDLFKGELEQYNQALDKLNACTNALEARDVFESMKQHFEWDENSKSVKRFADILTRKFL